MAFSSRMSWVGYFVGGFKDAVANVRKAGTMSTRGREISILRFGRQRNGLSMRYVLIDRGVEL